MTVGAGSQHATRDDERVDGYLALRGYAAIGDCRTLALVGRDGAIDWLCTPEFDGESLLGALLDAGRGGAATMRPIEPFAVERRYVDDTNVLETTFTTSLGVLRVTDAMQIDDRRDAPFRTILRRVECLAGTVDLTWNVSPRFSFAEIAPEVVPAGNGASLAGGGQTRASTPSISVSRPSTATASTAPPACSSETAGCSRWSSAPSPRTGRGTSSSASSTRPCAGGGTGQPASPTTDRGGRPCCAAASCSGC